MPELKPPFFAVTEDLWARITTALTALKIEATETEQPANALRKMVSHELFTNLVNLANEVATVRLVNMDDLPQFTPNHTPHKIDPVHADNLDLPPETKLYRVAPLPDDPTA